MHTSRSTIKVPNARIEYLADREDLIEEICHLHSQEWGYLTPNQTMEERAQKLRQCSGRGDVPTAFVAASEYDLLGTAMLVAHDMQTRPDLTPWLAGVYVKPEHRGNGVAATLIEHVAAAASRIGAPSLYLYTLPALERFYSRLGWDLLEYCEYKGLDVVIMARSV